MSEDRVHEFQNYKRTGCCGQSLSFVRGHRCGLPASAAIHQVAGVCAIHGDSVKLTPRGECPRCANDVHQVAEPCVDGDPMMHGPKPYRWCVTHNDLMLRCDRNRPGATNHERARQAAEKWFIATGNANASAASLDLATRQLTAIILETCFGEEIKEAPRLHCSCGAAVTAEEYETHRLWGCDAAYVPQTPANQDSVEGGNRTVEPTSTKGKTVEASEIDCCLDWAPQMIKLTVPIAIASMRNPNTSSGYQFKPFRFCPWCGIDHASVPDTSASADRDVSEGGQASNLATLTK